MDKTELEDRIEKKAASRFYAQMNKTIKLMDSDPILKKLRIEGKEKELNLVSANGVCYATDLFYSPTIEKESLLMEHTNIAEIKKDFIFKAIQEETQHILDNVSFIAEFLGNNQ